MKLHLIKVNINNKGIFTIFELIFTFKIGGQYWNALFPFTVGDLLETAMQLKAFAKFLEDKYYEFEDQKTL